MFKKKWWANLTGQNMNINISGRSFSGDVIQINGDNVGGKIIVNGVEQNGLEATPKISIEILGGSIQHVDTNLNLTCGEVTGNVKAGMNVKCGNISGNADAGMGIEAQDIGGDADAGMDVKARDISGDAKAGMSIKCNSIQGKAKSSF